MQASSTWEQEHFTKPYLWCLQHNIQACLVCHSYSQFDLFWDIIDFCLVYSMFYSETGKVLRNPRQTSRLKCLNTVFQKFITKIK